MTEKRIYTGKDVEMLTASQIAAENFSNHLNELSELRTDWTEEYATGLKTRIGNSLENLIGTDSKKSLRAATISVHEIIVPAKKKISFLKTQIDEDFRSIPEKRDTILKDLGFTKHLRNVQKGNQEAVVQFLYTFKTNLTPELRTDLLTKGISPGLLDSLTEYAMVVNQANVAQETNKGATKEVTSEMISAYNAIYTEVVGMCKKVANYYNDDPVKKQLFVYSKILSNLGTTRKAIEKIPAKIVE